MTLTRKTTRDEKITRPGVYEVEQDAGNLWRDAVKQYLADEGIDHVVHNYGPGACLAILVKAVEDRAAQPEQPACYVNYDDFDNMLNDRTATIETSISGFRKMPLYRTPQLAQPSNFAERCRLSEECLPDSPYLKMLVSLHDEMLKALRAPPASTKDAA